MTSNYDEFLNRFQGKEKTIPETVLEIVRKEIGDNTPSVFMIKQALKKHNCTHYLESTYVILYKLYGIKII